jgi:hypothetical protein
LVCKYKQSMETTKQFIIIFLLLKYKINLKNGFY